MDNSQAGRSGIGHTGTTKYPAENAKVRKNGGNDAKHDSVRREQSPGSMYGGSQGSLGKAKGK